VADRPEVAYHAIRQGAGSETVLSRRIEGVRRRGLTPHRSRHRVAARDTQALLFLFREAISAEVYAAGGPVFEVTLPADAPLYHDTKLRSVGSMFTTVALGPERVRKLEIEELVELSHRRS
jgi:hypothetical protein